jgi:hypothetical protein
VSLDIFVQDIPADISSVEDIPDDFSPKPIGTRSRVLAAIEKVAPEVKFGSPEWGTIEAKGYSIEVNLSVDDPVMGFAFHLHGGEDGLFLVADILTELGLRAFAPGTESGLFAVDRAGEAFSRWRAHRDRVVQR